MPIPSILRFAHLKTWNAIRISQRLFGDYERQIGLLEMVHTHSVPPAGGFARLLSIARGLWFGVMANALRPVARHLSQ